MATYKRILLKLSGESLMGEKQYGIDEKRLAEYAAQIKEIHELGVQIGIVIGGGNIFRGLSGANKGFDRVKGDQMGMLATVINSLALSSALVAAGVKARVLTAVRMEPIGEFYNKWRAIECMEAGEVVIMSAGTGNPFFTASKISGLLSQNTQEKTFVGFADEPDSKNFVHVNAMYTKVSDLENIVVAPGPILLKDVATFFFDLKDETTYSRVNGKEAVSVALINDSQANLIELSHRVSDVIEKLNEKLAPLELEIVIQSPLY